MINPFPLYTQLDQMDCGPTCLRMIAKYYGRQYSVQFLRERSFITRLGVSLLGISDAAEHIGFRSLYVRCDFKQLYKEAPLPCVLHWNQNHFVVCYKIKRKKNIFSGETRYIIYLADPADEKYTMNESEFKKCWISDRANDKEIGVALLLTPTPNFYQAYIDDEGDGKKGFLFFLKYLTPHKFQFLQLMIAMLIGSFISLISPFLTQAVVDQGIGNNDLSFITLILIAQVTISVVSMCMGFITSWISLYMNTQINISLISDYLSKLMRLPLRFFDSKNIGDIIQRIGDHGRIESFISGSAFTIVFSIANFIVFSIIMAYYNSTILLIFLIGNAIYSLWVLAFMRYRRKLDLKHFTQGAQDQSNLYGMLTTMQDIKLNNCELQQRWKWERIQIKLFKISIEGVTIGQIQSVGSVFFSQMTNVLISYLAAKAVVEGEITLGMMMSISYILGQLGGPISQFIGLTHSYQDAKISLERLNEIHGKKDESQDGERLIELPAVKDIIINNMSFSYSGSERDYVLKKLSLSIPQNKTTAIVGSSGSGKTTIMKLLLGFYTPQEGEINIGDTKLETIDPHLWRSKVGAVLQDSAIFSDTVAYNIAPGVENIDKQRLAYATKMANIKEFVEDLPMKYNTKIGMEGSGISQGQKQRLLIARAIYKDPDFIFLDEATNSLDSINEKTIINNLNTFFENKTVVIIAHRLSTVKNADNIIVLEKGNIIEQGTHQHLISLKGEYYNLIKNQLELDM